MRNKILLIMITVILVPSMAIAGRHSIAREEATRIVNERFNQFYRDEANRKKEEQQAMEQEIARAKNMEAVMLRQVQVANSNHIMTAAELERSVQQRFDLARSSDNSTTFNRRPNASGHNTFFDVNRGSKENNPFLFLQGLQNSNPTQRSAGIREVVGSLNSLPDSHKLAEEFAKDLAKISPSMAVEFNAAYQSNAESSKLENKAHPSTYSHNTFSDVTKSSKENNPLLFLQGLENVDATQRTSGINEVVGSLNGLPDSHKLAEEFAKDLAKTSPSMAAEFMVAYKANAKSSKLENKEQLSTSSHNTFFDATGSSKENNPLLFLQGLQTADATQRTAGINEVVGSLNGLPDSHKLAEEFAKDLAKTSPSMAAEFMAAYKTNAESSKLINKAQSSTSSRNSFFDATGSSKENNPLLFLQGLENADAAQRTAGINEVVGSLSSLPDGHKLAEVFTKDLAKTSPSMAAEFMAAYKSNAKSSKLLNKEQSSTSSHNSFFDVTGSSKENNQLLFLQGLESADATQRTAGINEVVGSLSGLPDSHKLAEEITKDLAKTSPDMAAEFMAVYKTNAKSSKLVNKEQSSASGHNTFFDATGNSKENNSLLFLQGLQDADAVQRSAGINEVVASLSNLPDSYKLAEEITNGLAKTSPSMAAEFMVAYKSNAKNPKLPNEGRSKKDTKIKVGNNLDLGNYNKQLLKKLVNRAIYPDIRGHKENFKVKHRNQSKTFNPITTYNFNPNKLYQIYTAPYKATAIVFAPGEKIIGTPVCGDLTRWKISTIWNAQGEFRNQYLMIQPLKAGLTTSITVTTNQGRLYVLEATSLKNNYMAIVRWNY